MNKRAEEIITSLGLVAHPEGGYYKEVYRSDIMLTSPQNMQIRNSITDIYFLLTSGQVSRFHRVIHDEIWNFYEGSPLGLVDLNHNTFEVSQHLLGEKQNQINYKHCICANHWQAAYTTGDYSLVGCSVAPGFDFADFEFLTEENNEIFNTVKTNPKLKFLL